MSDESGSSANFGDDAPAAPASPPGQHPHSPRPLDVSQIEVLRFGLNGVLLKKSHLAWSYLVNDCFSFDDSCMNFDRNITEVTDISHQLLGGQADDAENKLRQLLEINIPDLFSSLTAELADESKPLDARLLAGRILNIALEAKEQHRSFELLKDRNRKWRYDLLNRWLTHSVEVKDQIKVCLLQTLSSPQLDARRLVSKVIGRVAGTEGWPELISLFSDVHKVPANVKLAIQETFEYLCEEVSLDELIPLINAHLNSMLTALMTHPDTDVKDTMTLFSTAETTAMVLQLIHTLTEKILQPAGAYRNPYIEMKRREDLLVYLCDWLHGLIQELRGLEHMEPVINQIAHDILKFFSRVFGSNQLQLYIEPWVFLCFADIVLATGDDLESFLSNAMTELQNLLQACVRTRCSVDYGIVARTNLMRSGILLAYNDILNSFTTPKTQVQDIFLQHILHFIDDVCKEKDISDDVQKSVFKVLANIASGDNKDAYDTNKYPSIPGFLSECLASDDDEIKAYANETMRAILSATSAV